MVDSVYVHVYRPGTGTPALAGRLGVAQVREGRAVARFAYSRRYLESADAFDLDPVNLPRRTGEFETTKRFGMFGVFDDAGPDSWGNRLIRVFHGERSALERLLLEGDDRIGALAFSPAPEYEPGPASYLEGVRPELETFQTLVADLDAGRYGERQAGILKRFIAASSIGGARPKLAIRHAGGFWIAKFGARSDQFDQQVAEHATMLLSAACGIETPRTRLVSLPMGNVYMVERFDRRISDERVDRIHYASAMTFCDRSDSDFDGSYAMIADAISRVSVSAAADRRRLFERLAFNVLCGNTDDHLKNFGFVHDAGQGAAGWRLSPVFDVLPHPEREGVHAIAIHQGDTRGTLDNVRAAAARLGVPKGDAEESMERLIATLSGWQDRFRQAGVSELDIRVLRGCFRTLPAGKG